MGSAQWAEYYRSLGMTRGAEMIEQQQGGAATAPPTTAPAVSAAAPQGGSAPDYSAQWAEYYRSIGKTKEAEAIESQIRAKVPSSGAPGGPGPAQQPQYGAPGQPQPQYAGQQPGYQPAISQAYYQPQQQQGGAATAPPTTAPAVTAAAPQGGSAPDYSAQWAE